MVPRAVKVIGVLAATMTGGCLGTGRAAPRPADVPPSARVVWGKDLQGRGGSLLSAMASRVGNLQVRYSSNCPEIVMRGQKRIQGASYPRVYVNGSPVLNTCILDQLNPEDVERLELYPTGMTPRPGYFAGADGLILVFMRRAES